MCSLERVISDWGMVGWMGTLGIQGNFIALRTKDYTCKLGWVRANLGWVDGE